MFFSFLKFLKEEDGQTSTEYILLLVVVATVIFKFKSVLQSRLEALTNIVFNNAEKIAKEITVD